jgi:hypothetical protein
MKNEASISIKKDYVMMTYNPVLNKIDYSFYHVMDISYLNNECIVNIRYRDSNDQLCRISLSKQVFDQLLDLKYLTATS